MTSLMLWWLEHPLLVVLTMVAGAVLLLWGAWKSSERW